MRLFFLVLVCRSANSWCRLECFWLSA